MTKGTTSMGKFTRKKTPFTSEENNAQNVDTPSPTLGNIIGLSDRLYKRRITRLN
jgi:hypothetical protein